MSIPQKSTRNKSLAGYLPAVLKKNKSGWLIEYYVENPFTKDFVRKQIKLSHIINRYELKREGMQHVNKMIETLNTKLANGWTPFYEQEDSRLYESFTTVCDKFITEKTKTLRKNTLRSYQSFVNQIKDWQGKNYPNLYFSMFNKSVTVRFLDFIFEKETVGARTYNNMVKIGRAVWNWGKEKCYTKENPFETIKVKPKPRKTRIIIPKDTRDKITEYLNNQGNIGFNIVCRLVYTSLIRPKEILELRIKDVNLQEKYICVPSEVAKNHKQRYSALNQEIIELFKKINLEKQAQNDYLFGSNLLPVSKSAGNARLRKEWDKLRKELQLPNEMQLYSFRDTGIYEMLKSGIDNLTVMQHADHSSLDITTIYANHADNQLISKIYEKAPKF